MNSADQEWSRWREEVLARVDPARTVFAVIDVQRDFCAPDGALAQLGSDVAVSGGVAKGIAEFLPVVREVPVAVAFLRLVHSPEAMTGALRERLLRDGRPVVCDPNGSGSELYLVRPEAGEPVFVKHRYSAFTCAPFTKLLAEREVQNIVVAGVDTHICVESTVRAGFDLGYRMLVLEDLVGTRSAANHDASLSVMRRYFGIVTSSRGLLQHWAARRDVVDSARRSTAETR